MKFAINYSHPAAELVSAGRIHIDFFKCPDWPDLIDEASRIKPVAVHFDLKAGSGRLKDTHWGHVERLLEQTGTPYVNLHLDPTVHDFPDIPQETDQPEHVQCILERLVEDTAAVVERFGPERVIAENVPYRGSAGKILRPAALPEVIRQVLDETGCGLLLDISHARIAAHHLGMDEEDYMGQLPIGRLRELHFTGIHWIGDRLQDHLSVLEDDWPVLDWVMERIRHGDWASPWMLAFEYGGVGEKFAWRSDPAVMAAQVPRLVQTVRDI